MQMLHTSSINPHCFAHRERRTLPGVLARLAIALSFIAIAATAGAATITVNSLADDVYVDASGAIFSDVAMTTPVVLASPKCTLRMAIASANLDLTVGGANGCAAGDSESTTTAPFAQPNGYADRIVFTTGLAGTINVNVAARMNEAPALFLNGTGGANPNLSSALVVSRPLIISGNFDGAGQPTITLDGGLLANASVNGRILVVSDGNNEVDTPFELDNLRFANARVEAGSGGCLFSRESVRIRSVSFANCVVVATAAGSGYAGALGVFTTRNTAVASNPVPHARPNVYLTGVSVSNSKAVRVAGATSAAVAGAFGFGGATGYVGNVTVIGGLIDNNEGESIGAMHIRNALGVIIRGVDYTNNRAIGARDIVNVGLDGGFVGAVGLRDFVSVHVADTNFINNVANRAIGALEARDGSSLSMANLTVRGNRAGTPTSTGRAFAAGIRTNNVTNIRASRLTIDQNVVDSPTAVSPDGSNFGAGMAIASSAGLVELFDSVISANTMKNGFGGGIDFFGNANVALDRVKFLNNLSPRPNGYGGGYAAFGGSQNGAFRISDSTVSGNVSDNFAVINLSASYNDSTVSGGVRSPAVTLPPTTNTVLFENFAMHNNTANASMLFVTTPGTYTFRNVTISENNVLAGCTGGLQSDAFNPYSAADALKLRVYNSTIARNTVSSCAAAITLSSFDSLNTATPAPFNGNAIIESSILGKENAASTKDVLSVADVSKLTLVNSLLENSAGSANALCGTNGLICNVDANLEALGNNGGPTKTMLLKGGSRAINAGSNPQALAFDQRGATRVLAGVADMGAVESGVANCSLDMDGINGAQAVKEGLVLTRAMLGFSNAAAVVGTGISEAQWAATKANLNANCGTNFAP